MSAKGRDRDPCVRENRLQMTQKEMTSPGKRASSLKMDNIQHFDEKNAE